MATTFKIVNGDVVVSSMSGRPVTLQGRDATKQHVAENLSIDQQSNGIGAGVRQLVGTVPTDATAMAIVVTNRIRDSFSSMRALQLADYNCPRDNNEVIATVRNLVVIPAPSDPRNYLYTASIMTVAGQALAVSDILSK